MSGRIWWIILHQILPGTRILPDLPPARHTVAHSRITVRTGITQRQAACQAWLKRKLRFSPGWRPVDTVGRTRLRPPPAGYGDDY
jgi:hypothetical protein